MSDIPDQSNSDIRSQLLQKDLDSLSRRIDDREKIYENLFLKKSDTIKLGWPVIMAVVFAAGTVGWNVTEFHGFKDQIEAMDKKYIDDLDRLRDESKTKLDKEIEQFNRDFKQKIDEKSSELSHQIEDLNKVFQKKIEENTIQLLQQSEQSIKDKAKDFINPSSEQILKNLKQQVMEEIEEKASTAASNEFEKKLKNIFGKKYSRELERIAEAAKNFSVDSGMYICKKEDISFSRENGKKYEIYSQYIPFAAKFQRKPFVLISVNGFDTTINDNNLAFWAIAQEDSITPKGFNFRLTNFNQNSTKSCKIHWLAIDQFSDKQLDR